MQARPSCSDSTFNGFDLTLPFVFPHCRNISTSCIDKKCTNWTIEGQVIANDPFLASPCDNHLLLIPSVRTCNSQTMTNSVCRQHRFALIHFFESSANSRGFPSHYTSTNWGHAFQVREGEAQSAIRLLNVVSPSAEHSSPSPASKS